MSFLDPLKTPTLLTELRAGSLHLFNGNSGEDLVITTDAEGRPDAASQARVREALLRLAPRKPWQSRGTLWCALPARGVSFRTVKIPDSARDGLRLLLTLQIEAQFPVPPESLVWGWCEPSKSSASSTRADGLREIQVAALKKELVEDYAALFSSCGFNPVFTIAALLRSGPNVRAVNSSAVLEVGARGSEFLARQESMPSLVRILPWGGEQISAALVRDFDMTPTEAEHTCVRLIQADSFTTERRTALMASVVATVAPLVQSIQRLWSGPELLVVGDTPAALLAARVLEESLRPTVIMQRIELDRAPGQTFAVRGIWEATKDSSDEVPLRLELKPTASSFGGRRTLPEVSWKWVTSVAGLLAALLLFPYAEALVGRPLLARRLANLQKDYDRLGEIDRRLEFLQYIADNQPPYLDASFVIANAAPPGARIESLSLNRRGEISLSGFAQMPQQIVDFRTKLVESGFFSQVVVEEQSPVQPNQPRSLMRITAQWKGHAERQALMLGPTLPEKANTNSVASDKGAATNSSPTESEPSFSNPAAKN